VSHNQRYIDYADYNIWANSRLISDLKGETNEWLTQHIVGSFPSIRATIQHIWMAEAGWLSKLKGKGWNATKVIEFKGTQQELFKAWQATSQEFKDFVSESDLEARVPFTHKQEEFSIPAREIMQTVFNHGSYHRGQVVMMMRQLGVTGISQTDYIEWVREKERGNI
jgi:uncharacterized damage-inducible protein DinB